MHIIRKAKRLIFTCYQDKKKAKRLNARTLKCQKKPQIPKEWETKMCWFSVLFLKQWNNWHQQNILATDVKMLRKEVKYLFLPDSCSFVLKLMKMISLMWCSLSLKFWKTGLKETITDLTSSSFV